MGWRGPAACRVLLPHEPDLAEAYLGRDSRVSSITGGAFDLDPALVRRRDPPSDA